ncbi:GTPase Era [candidate division KSB1 bacterium]|nr:GTPase Era [candidate division KSB1 bacterium]
MTTESNKEAPFHSGYAVLVGRPNVGKSTLMNALLEEKLAIVTPRPQTTRQQILGILNGENFQAVLLDTPGILTPKYLLQEKMVHSVKKAISSADIIIMLTEVEKKVEDEQLVLDLIESYSVPKVLVINKIDTTRKEKLLPAIAAYQGLDRFQTIIPISALQKDGIERLVSELHDTLPVGQPFYPPDMLSNEPERFFVAELIREKIFFQFRDEVPYSTAVHVESFKEESGKKTAIEAVITVERESQKGILIGKGGLALKKVGTSARYAIELFLDCPVYLKLTVRVRSNWRKNAQILRQLGYE